MRLAIALVVAGAFPLALDAFVPSSPSVLTAPRAPGAALGRVCPAPVPTRRCALGLRMQDDVAVKEGKKATAPVSLKEMQQEIKRRCEAGAHRLASAA
jgi:hypothetical protein